jgi:hypothetical protein
MPARIGTEYMNVLREPRERAVVHLTVIDKALDA